MQQAAAKGVDFGMVALPGIDGKAKATDGRRRLDDGVQAERPPPADRQVPGLRLQREERPEFSGEYGLLPVTESASQAMLADRRYAKLHGFLKQLGNAEFYPVDKTSWPLVSKTIKAKVAGAVGPGGNPEGVLTDIQNDRGHRGQRRRVTVATAHRELSDGGLIVES